jgi:SAM-dependent methyltransferase
MSTDWIAALLGQPLPAAGERTVINGRPLINDGKVLRDEGLIDDEQAQTRDAFAFKWEQRGTYSSPAMRETMRAWLRERYGDFSETVAFNSGETPTVLDAGCGAGFSGSLALKELLGSAQYVGADISTAIDIAAETIRPLAKASFFVQANLMSLPFAASSFDLVFSEGVLHHTPSTRDAFLVLSRLLKPGGAFAFYVYAKKGPVREFTDDLLRAAVSDLSPAEAWKQLMPLTKLGKALGELDVSIDVPENIPLLGIPQGRIDIQRLFYWYVCKAYYRPEYSLDEMNHINFDWFMPKYCHRQTPEEVKTWCLDAGLTLERMKVEEAGITVIARRLA